MTATDKQQAAFESGRSFFGQLDALKNDMSNPLDAAANRFKTSGLTREYWFCGFRGIEVSDLETKITVTYDGETDDCDVLGFIGMAENDGHMSPGTSLRTLVDTGTVSIPGYTFKLS